MDIPAAMHDFLCALPKCEHHVSLSPFSRNSSFDLREREPKERRKKKD